MSSTNGFRRGGKTPLTENRGTGMTMAGMDDDGDDSRDYGRWSEIIVMMEGEGVGYRSWACLVACNKLTMALTK